MKVRHNPSFNKNGKSEIEKKENQLLLLLLLLEKKMIFLFVYGKCQS
jgi:hypothetical protein